MKSDFKKYIDEKYSLEIINQLITFGSNPELGFRTSGSAAEHSAADFLYNEMKRIGLENVRKEEVTVDNFEFLKAELTYSDSYGETKKVIMSSFQAESHSENEKIEIIYVGKGRDSDYEHVDVEGRYVLLDINMIDDWFINWPVEQAKFKKAKGVIVVQTAGYCSYSDTTLGVQDIQTYGSIPVFSITVHDAVPIKEEIEKAGGVLNAILDSEVRVIHNGKSENVIGEIPGKIDEVIYLIGHYDAYFRAFSDNSSGIGCILGICKAFVESGYKPNRTLRVVLHSAEEWGLDGTRYDWAMGAYRQVKAHNEWGENGFFLVNLDGGVVSSGASRALVKTSYELEDEIQKIGDSVEGTVYPFGTTSPLWTWTESYIYAQLGIPTIESHLDGVYFWDSYHSTSDTKETAHYDDEVYRSSHILYGSILQELDERPVRPLHFERVWEKLESSIDESLVTDKAGLEYLKDKIYELISINETLSNKTEEFDSLDDKVFIFNSKISDILKLITNELFGLDWADQYDFIHVRNQTNITFIKKALAHIRDEQIPEVVIDDLKNVDLCRYAFSFDKNTYQSLVDQVLGEHARESWGTGKIGSIVNLYDTCRLISEWEKGARIISYYAIDSLEKELRNQEEELNLKLKRETMILERILEIVKSAVLP